MLEKKQMSLLTGSCPQTLASWRLILQVSVKSKTAIPMRLSHGIYADSLCFQMASLMLRGPDAGGKFWVGSAGDPFESWSRKQR